MSADLDAFDAVEITALHLRRLQHACIDEAAQRQASSPELTGYKRHDFYADINPFMAFAARCTSSLPFVFEPMTLNEAHEMLGAYPAYDNKPWADLQERWKAFFWAT